MPKNDVKQKGGNVAKKRPKTPKMQVTRAPLAMSNGSRSSTPKTMVSPNGTVVSHSEVCAADILAYSLFTVNDNFAVQPAITTASRGEPLFSWLPSLGKQYDNYEFLHLSLHYYTSASALRGGLVMMAYEPNPDAREPSDFPGLRNMHSVSGAVRENLSFDVTQWVKGRKLLSRIGGVVALPLYDAGRLFLATIGGDGLSCGYVEVKYTVKLSNPQTASAVVIPKDLSPSLPTVVFASNVQTESAYNCATNSSYPFNAFCLSALVNGDLGLLSIANRSMPAYNFSIQNGCKYVDAGGPNSIIECLVKGRYRARLQWNGDFEDLKLFSMVPVKSSAPYTTAVVPSIKNICLDGTTADTVCIPATHRGFTGVAALDPNPATDLPLVGEWEFDLAPTERLAFALGIRTYNNVSVSTANYQIKVGTGPSFIRVEYLGPQVVDII